MDNLYYTQPSDEIFAEVLAKAIEVWKDYSDENGYMTEKVSSIETLQNVKDNVMYIVAMFDLDNQKKLAEKLSKEARQAIRERMIDGGNPEYMIMF